ncbi:MAG: quinol:cytochrome C oxidoreductase [Bacteroidia bacterium]|nr:quinol:cytochrome C oxidoreductase [Bacteroidia bacterium]MBP7244653.1 quinol:cytochrome C oxidoreductase [Bacteroidia bacterium]
MGHHGPIEVTTTQPYDFTSKNKMYAIAMIVIGIVSIAAQFMTHHEQTWANLLWSNFIFMALALGATFFLALQYVAEVGWSAVIYRPLEAMGQSLPIAGIIMIIIIAFGGQQIYHWMGDGLTDPNSANYDKIIAGKSAFLNPGFFWVRVILYFVIWSFFARLFRSNSLKMDEGSDSVGAYLRNRRSGAAFLVLFAITESLMSWDFIMSIESHWYSTLFGWYTFAGLFVTTLAVLAFIVAYLKHRGYLEEVTEHHLHDIGKFMFAFSIFWTYLWFSQFMLIWYSNIGEEVTYFMLRQDHYRGIWLAAFFINFIAPFLILMTRDAKRKKFLLMFMSIVIFVGHWLDFYIMVVPGSMVTATHALAAHGADAAHAAHGAAAAHHELLIGSIGWMEVGTTIGFIGLFAYITQHYMSKSPLVVKNHPMMEESLHHAI